MTPPTAAGVDSELVDLSHLPVRDLPHIDIDLVAPILRKVLRRADDPESVTSGHHPQRR